MRIIFLKNCLCLCYIYTDVCKCFNNMCQLFSQQNVMFSRSRLLHNTILKYISIISPIVFFNQISAVNMKDRKISNFFNLSHGLYAYVHISTTRCASCMPDTVMYFSVKEHVIFLFSPEKNEATFCWFWNQTQNLMIKGSWDSLSAGWFLLWFMLWFQCLLCS